jgi:sugar/nucleoside kinase (ribokinase family)
MANVGGGGPQVLWGYAASSAALDVDESAKIALAAGVGDDLPPNVSDWLSGPCLGADLSGLRPTPGGAKTPRAWQILEKDGKRTQVWRCDESDALYERLRPRFETLPPRLRNQARSYHIGLHAAHPPKSLLRRLREAVDQQRRAEEAEAGGAQRQRQRCLLSAETYTRCEQGPLSATQLRHLLAPLDVFSPNEEEAASMLGVRLRHSRGDDKDDDDASADEEEEEARAAEEAERLLLDALLDAAPQQRPLTVTLRRGGRGALAKTNSGGGGSAAAAAVCVPAVAGLRVVDPVGCGNAFCGGYLAAVHAGRGLEEAVAWGCAAGGTMAEHVGVPRAPVKALAPVVARRARELAAAARGRASSSSSLSAGGVVRRLV